MKRQIFHYNMVLMIFKIKSFNLVITFLSEEMLFLPMQALMWQYLEKKVQGGTRSTNLFWPLSFFGLRFTFSFFTTKFVIFIIRGWFAPSILHYSALIVTSSITGASFHLETCTTMSHISHYHVNAGVQIGRYLLLHILVHCIHCKSDAGPSSR